MRWEIEGDKNSRFFHSLLKSKYTNFNIKGVHVNRVWCDSLDDIKQAALDHFSARFKEPNLCRPSFNSYLFRILSISDASFLESSITLDEIKEAVLGCEGSKAPPADLNFKFLKGYWEILKNEFIACIKYFEPLVALLMGVTPLLWL